MFKLVVVLIALAGLNQANASSFTFGSCAKSPVISDFSIEKYVGRWYQIEHIEAPFEPDLKCVTATYTQENATQIGVDNKGIKIDTGLEQGIQGYAYVTDLKAPNQLTLKFPNIPSGSYNVWETDYTGYTLIYSCSQIVPFVLKNELIWIMSRQPSLDQATVLRLRNSLSNNGVSAVPNLLVTDHSTCPN